MLAESAIIGARMPSPIGHALAGRVPSAWAADAMPRPRPATAPNRAGDLRRSAPASLLAALPDVDLLLPHAPHGHPQRRAPCVARPDCRGGRDRAGHSVWRRVALICAAAYASHCCSTGSASTDCRRRHSAALAVQRSTGSSPAGTSFRQTERRDHFLDACRSMMQNLLGRSREELAILGAAALLRAVARYV